MSLSNGDQLPDTEGNCCEQDEEDNDDDGDNVVLLHGCGGGGWGGDSVSRGGGSAVIDVADWMFQKLIVWDLDSEGGLQC